MSLETDLLARLEAQALEIARLQAKLVAYDNELQRIIEGAIDRKLEVVTVDLDMFSGLENPDEIRLAAAQALAKQLVAFMTIEPHVSGAALKVRAKTALWRWHK